MFGVKHHLVPGFQLHFHGSELLGEVAGRSLQQAPCHVHSHLLPGTLGKGYACTQSAAIFAIASLNASCSIEDGTESPFCPSVSNTVSSTGMMLPAYSMKDTSMSSRSPCTFAVPATRVFFGTTMFPACMVQAAGVSPPAVRQGLVLVDAGGYRVLSHSVARAHRRVEAVVAWLAVRPDEVGIAHGLLFIIRLIYSCRIHSFSFI